MKLAREAAETAQPARGRRLEGEIKEVEMTLLVVQLLGHAAAVVTFAAVAMYGSLYRNSLRRNLRRSRYLYRLILATGVIFALVHLFRLYTLAVGSPSSGVFAWMDVAAEYPSVIAQSIIIFYLIANKIIVTRAAQSRKVLVIGAHPEEYELAAGATLAKMHDTGYQIYGLVLSGGEQAGRTAPGADFLGIGREERRGFAENSLKDHLDDLTQAIREAIASVGPQIILTTSCHDRSPDRQAVFADTLAAGADQNAILSYESRAAG
ncbi:MAG TPA: PIG-L family deacetylase, partial [Anaerolineaceae bacterium]